ncbi:MAG TPA: hypothetical protein PKA37_00135 [Planctomycetota bacterium]|jgi:hypothetical protein|nr:hypothetical protein [Planctomycetota bacterium]
MTDAQSICLVLGFLYIVECCAWIRKDAVIFRSHVGLRAAVMRSSGLLGSAWGSVVLRTPWPPLGFAYRAAQFPFSADEERVVFWVPEVMSAEGRSEQSATTFEWAALGAVEVRDRSVWIRGEEVLKTYAPQAAEIYQELLANLRDTEPSARLKRLGEGLDRALDLSAILSRHADAKIWDFPLRILTNLFTIHLLIVIPIALLTQGILASWHWLLPIAALLMVATVIVFLLAHRRLHPRDPGSRVQHAFLMLIFPPAACRAHDVLALDLFAGFHPVAIGAALLNKEDQVGWFSERLRDLSYPLFPTAPDGPEGKAVESFRILHRERVRHFVERLGFSSAILEESAPPNPDGAKSYCPRCHAGFIELPWECATCGRSTLPFPT